MCEVTCTAGVLKQFVEVVLSKLNCGYAYSAQGEILNPNLLQTWVFRYGKKRYYFDGFSVEQWFGKEVYDCSGLIIYGLQQVGIFTKNQDYTAGTLYCKFCIDVKRDELEIGDLCFVDDGVSGITHVGLYIGNNKVIHARGTQYGVVVTDLYSSFNVFGRLKFFQNIDKPWEQIMGENAIEYLVDNEIIDSPDYWKSQDLKNTPVPLWLLFEITKRIMESNR